jgi:hypothetical protein
VFLRLVYTKKVLGVTEQFLGEPFVICVREFFILDQIFQSFGIPVIPMGDDSV